MVDRIDTRLPKPLADHVKRMVGSNSLYETPGEYIRSLIRKDMESANSQIFNAIIEGCNDFKEGRTFRSSGDWKTDKAMILEKVKPWLSLS